MALAPLLASAGILLAAAAGAVVFWDATRVAVGRPRLWAAFVFVSVAVGLTLPVVVPRVPIPGTLVILIVGPVLYAFERDDTLHGEDGGDPTALPSDGAGDDTDEE